MQRNYEAVVVVDPRLEEAPIKAAIGRLSTAIEAKGELTKVDEWGRRRLAYEIDHLTEGHYFVASFKAAPEAIGEFNRLLELGEEYIRHKIVRVPDVVPPPRSRALTEQEEQDV